MARSDIVFNNRVRQVLLLLLLLALFVLFVNQLYFLAPGFLGAVTLYILSQDYYTRLTRQKKWNKHATAILFITLFTIVVGLPVYGVIALLAPRVRAFVGNPEQLMEKAKIFSQGLEKTIGFDVLSAQSSKDMLTKFSNMIPEILNGTALVVGNFALIIFLAYFMLLNQDKMEKAISNFIPLKDRNVELLGQETKHMVRANAIGIPLISLIQAGFATAGYWLFGIQDFVVWGFITGIFAFFPIIGTAMIWIPLVASQYAAGETANATWLLIYSAVVIGNVDYFARMSILKRIGQVHPVITIIGVILGLKLFGFWGFIFGPLLISYLILLLKIYNNEFGTLDPQEHPIKVMHKPSKP